jgi:hypothetical protein
MTRPRTAAAPIKAVPRAVGRAPAAFTVCCRGALPVGFRVPVVTVPLVRPLVATPTGRESELVIVKTLVGMAVRAVE